MNKKHLYGLDIIRGTSALLIVLYHYTTRYNESRYITQDVMTKWPVSLPWESMAVCTFFLLSGFLSNIYQDGNAVEYVKKRFIRIWPTFAVCCILTSICMALFLPQAFLGIKYTLYNITMLPIFFGGYV